MNNKLILLVDDHPLILEGYKNVLLNTKFNNSHNYTIQLAENLSDAHRYLFETNNKYDIVCLDMNLPASENLGLYSGEDLGIKLRAKNPDIALIVLTMFDDNFRIYNLIRNLNPEGFLIKKDVKPFDLAKAFSDVVEGKTYYSATVNSLIRKRIQQEFVLDKIDRQLIYYISKGVKTKDLPDLIPLSLAAIEKRKRQIKEAFKIAGQGDIHLIDRARELGFL
ncbi:response regulator transcription factor [Gramella sp. BOM4]|nr:response regulator transcription factor [Christiangramia bathymodioli]